MKKKQHDDVDRLEQENKELKQEVRLLNRRLKKLSKNQRDETDDEPFADFEKKPTYDVENRCSECKQGRIVTIELGPRKQLGCNNCDWRGRITKK